MNDHPPPSPTSDMPPAPSSGGGIGHGFALALGGVVLAVWVAMMTVSVRQAALPDDTDGLVLAVFRPGTPDHEAFGAMVRAGGEPVRATWLGFAWVARGREAGFVGRLKSEGALGALGEIPLGPTLGGCSAEPVDSKKMASVRLQPQ